MLVFGEGTGGGTLRELLFITAVFVVLLLGRGPAAEVEGGGGPGGGLRGEPCNDDDDIDGDGP